MKSLLHAKQRIETSDSELKFLNFAKLKCHRYKVDTTERKQKIKFSSIETESFSSGAVDLRVNKLIKTRSIFKSV